MLWPHPCTKTPPPPCELSVMVRPSILDGLHQKLLVKPPCTLPPGQYRFSFCLLLVNRTVLSGNPASNVESNGFDGKNAPLDRTVMAAPSSAPIKLGSCNSSARLPLRLACQPTVASRGRRSTCGLFVVGLKPNQPDPQLD